MGFCCCPSHFSNHPGYLGSVLSSENSLHFQEVDLWPRFASCISWKKRGQISSILENSIHLFSSALLFSIWMIFSSDDECGKAKSYCRIIPISRCAFVLIYVITWHPVYSAFILLSMCENWFWSWSLMKTKQNEIYISFFYLQLAKSKKKRIYEEA